MLQILVNNQALQFEGTIRFRILSPLFYDQLPFSYEFTIDGTDDNNRILGFLIFPEVLTNTYKYENAIANSHIIQLAGTLTVRATSGKKYRAYFVANSKQESFKTFKLTDLTDKYVLNTSEEYDYEEVASKLKTADDNDMETVGPEACADYNLAVVYHPNHTKKSEHIPDEWLGKSAYSHIRNFINDHIEYDVNFCELADSNDKLYGFQSHCIPFFYVYKVFKKIIDNFKIICSENDNILRNEIGFRNLLFFNTTCLNIFSLYSGVANNYTRRVTAASSEESCKITCNSAHNLLEGTFVKFTLVDTLHDEKIRIADITNSSEAVLTVLNAYRTAGDYVKIVAIGGNNTMPEINNLIVKIKSVTILGSIYYLTIDLDTTEFGTYSDTDTSYLRIEHPKFGEIDYPKGYWQFSPEGDDLLSGTLKDFNSAFRDIYSVMDSPDIGSYYLTMNRVPLISKYGDIRLRNHVPDITINEFFNELEKYLGIKFIFSLTGEKLRVVKLDDVIKSTTSVDISKYCVSEIDIDHTKKDGYEVNYTADSGDEHFTSTVKEITGDYTIKDAVATIDDLPETGNEHNDIRLVTNYKAYMNFGDIFTGAYFVFTESTMLFNSSLDGKLTTNGKWEFFSEDFYGVNSGKKELSIISKFSTVLNAKGVNPSYYATFAHSENQLSYLSFPAEKQPNPMRLFFRFYPQGSANYFIPVSFLNYSKSLSLDYQGFYNFYDKLYKSYIYWQTNIRKDCEATIIWPAHLLYDFDCTKKYMINNITYLVKAIEFEIDYNENIKFSNTELAQC